MYFVNKFSELFTPSRLLGVVSLLLLQACSGGSGGGSSDREEVAGDNGSGNFIYSGPVAANSDIQNFKTAFYDNAVIRCGSCHTRDGVGTIAFVDNDDVNVAWEEAKKVVNLLDAGASEVVIRVDNGHNCWLSSNASCAASMTGYIERWAQGTSQSVSSVTLIPRAPQPLAGLKVMPPSYAEAVDALSFDLTTDPELMFLLKTYCSDCHSGESSTPQSPFFAGSNNDNAYAALSGLVDLANPANSRFTVKLRGLHNCWTNDCAADAQVVENAISRLAEDLPVVEVDTNLVISAAQIIEKDGIIASGGGRFEDDVIAKWEFREGEGSQVADTSGVQPETPLTVLGDFQWVGGWGVRLEEGRVQAAVSGSSKLYDRIAVVGEYTIEAWVAPNNVTQEDAWIFGYAGGPSSRNALLTQTLYNYDFYNRSLVNPVSDGGPAVSTADADEIAQATLQHVVLTYDPLNGRKIYVNGVDTGAVDDLGGGGLSNWSNAFALVMGNNFSGTAAWAGVIRMVAVHSRSLSAEQIVQNYDVGVGQKYFLMFSVSDLIDDEGVCHVIDAESVRTDYCYVVFQVSQFDSFSYLFSEPRFVNINPDAGNSNLNFEMKGVYLGVNGKLARTGQGFVNINRVINGSSFTIDDDPLQANGSIVPLENGPDSDVFFLAFQTLNGIDDQRSVAVPGSFAYLYPDNEASQIGMRSFDEVNQTFSWLTGIPIDSSVVSNITSKTISQTFATVRRSLASVSDFQTYMASHQMAVTQLAGAYCDALAEDSSLRAQLFNDGVAFDFNQPVEAVSDADWSSKVIYPLIDRMFATGLNSQPNRALDGDDADGLADRGDVHNELLNLITDTADDAANELTVDGKTDGLKYCNTTPCPAGRTAEVVKAVCTAVLASAPAMIK
jgi:mono/diheme cytochrome c family protein